MDRESKAFSGFGKPFCGFGKPFAIFRKPIRLSGMDADEGQAE
jgi:hypothetical protein